MLANGGWDLIRRLKGYCPDDCTRWPESVRREQYAPQIPERELNKKRVRERERERERERTYDVD